MATRFVLSCLVQRIAGMRDQLEDRIRSIARRETDQGHRRNDSLAIQNEYTKVRADLERAQRNLALAENQSQYQAVASVFEELKKKEAELGRRIQCAREQEAERGDVDSEIGLAMALADKLARLTNGEQELATATELIRRVDARLYLRFHPVRKGKRTLNKLTGGILTLGAAPAPITIYQGPTSKKAFGGREAKNDSSFSFVSGLEDGSLGNVNRGDKI
jgi:hypothetical protein